MDLRNYWTACRLHDWHYSYSDDPGVYREGAESEADLLRHAWGRPDLTEMYNMWKDYMFGSGAKPKEPKVEE
jgi:hypothetical protein